MALRLSSCCSFWCDDCLPFHDGIRTNKEHRVLALKDFRDEDFEIILKHPPFCAKHEEKLKFFSQVFKTAICYSCAVTDHEGHAKIVLEDAAKERKLRIVRAVEFKKREAQNKVTRIAKLDENCTQVQEEPARIKSDIQKFTNNLIAAIEAKMNEIFQEVEMKAKQCLERLREKRREIEGEMKPKDQTVIEESNIILKRSTSAQIMQPNDFLDELFRKEGEQEDTVDLNGEQVIDFYFQRNEELFNDVYARQLGFLKRKTSPKESTVEGKGISEGTVGLKAEIVVKARNIQGKQVHDENNRVTMEIRNHEGHDCSTKPQIHDRKNGSYKISYFAKESGTCQASVNVNGEHVRGSPFKTELKPRLFKPVFSFGKPGSADGMLSGPWGIAVNDKDEIAVTDRDNHRIQTFVCNGTQLRSFGRQDTNNHRVQIFDDQGHFLRQFGEKGKLNDQLYCPYGLATDSDDNIIVADYYNKSIKIFALDGLFLRKIGEDGSFAHPIHCIQHDNYFIVSDYGGHCIKVFDKQGKFLYKFGGRGRGDGDFYQPFCLSVDRAGHLLVCDSMNHRVQVFKLNGEFVTKFGAPGKEEGKFNQPISTAILSDGRIIVTEYRNDRVQVFE
ncbi:E3 ubiquitin-protein ligase TRIM71-like [Montipora capricornis]|uniref:E3 ubiquitin-protein ligase TRIM71-like n=1 Tax=Montipora capricornis TaxID=246305 RepID=UPI0035F1298C